VEARGTAGARAEHPALGRLLLAHDRVEGVVKHASREREGLVPEGLAARGEGRVVLAQASKGLVDVAEGQSNATAMSIDDIVQVGL
jgi:hypothetical protein